MNGIFVKFGIPCGIVLLLGFMPLLLSFIPQPSYQIDIILQDILIADHPADVENRFNLHLSFLERVANPNDEGYQQSILSLRYQAGQQFAKRNDKHSIEAALRQYQHIEMLNPAYNHGWLPFLKGEALQILQRWDEAASAFSHVLFYNHSRLALRAKFLELMIRSEQLQQPVSSKDVYHYLRFASEYPFSDALRASKWQWVGEENKHEYANYINALAEYELGNKEAAFEFINKANYIPGTNYFRDLFSGSLLNSVYPVQGDLLSASYYKGSLINGKLMLEEEKSLFTDFYVGIDHPANFRLELRYDFIPSIQPQFEIILNQSTALELKYDKDQQSAWIDFQPPMGRNLVEIRWHTATSLQHHTSQTHDAITKSVQLYGIQGGFHN